MPDGIWEVGGRPAPGPGRHAEPRKFRSALPGSIHPAATGGTAAPASRPAPRPGARQAGGGAGQRLGAAEIARQYDEGGPDGPGDRRRNAGAKPLLAAEAEAALRAMTEPPSDGRPWTGPEVAAWMAT